GRLGLIARVALRLHPRPAASVTVVVEADDLRGAWSTIHRSQLAPSAVDLLPPERMALLFEGARAAVDAQVGHVRGQTLDTSVWAKGAEGRGTGGRARFGCRTCLLARRGIGPAGVGVEAPEPAWPPLAERVRAAFDPEGVLV